MVEQTKPRVLNKYKHADIITKDDVYITRPGKFGNKYVIGKDGNRAEVVKKFRIFAYNNPDYCEMVQRELKGRNVVCVCNPLECHGDVLIEIANS
jgi:hypothetical protein